MFGRQLYDLLGGIESVGEKDTFDELSDHAKDIAQLHNLFRRRQSHIQIQLLHEFIRTPLDTVCADLVTEVKKPNHVLSLDETVRAQTLLLLGYNR